MFLGKWISSDKKRNRASSGDMPQTDAFVGTLPPEKAEGQQEV